MARRIRRIGTGRTKTSKCPSARGVPRISAVCDFTPFGSARELGGATTSRTTRRVVVVRNAPPAPADVTAVTLALIEAGIGRVALCAGVRTATCTKTGPRRPLRTSAVPIARGSGTPRALRRARRSIVSTVALRTRPPPQPFEQRHENPPLELELSEQVPCPLHVF